MKIHPSQMIGILMIVGFVLIMVFCNTGCAETRIIKKYYVLDSEYEENYSDSDTLVIIDSEPIDSDSSVSIFDTEPPPMFYSRAHSYIDGKMMIIEGYELIEGALEYYIVDEDSEEPLNCSPPTIYRYGSFCFEPGHEDMVKCAYGVELDTDGWPMCVDHIECAAYSMEFESLYCSEIIG